jgi:hypothetical protein
VAPCLKIYKTKTLPVVLYECETCTPKIRDQHRLKEFENRVLMKIFVPKREKLREAEEDCIIRSFITCTLQQLLLR